MKNFTQKIIGLLALVFAMSFTVNAQGNGNTDVCSEIIESMNQQIVYYASLYSDCNSNIYDIENQLNQANWQIVSLEQQYNSTNQDLIAANQKIDSLENLINALYTQDELDAAGPLRLNTPLNLPEGWSMFGYTCHEDLDVFDAFSDISTNIEIVKDEWGLAYIPAWDFTAFQTLEFGEGYQIKVIEEVTGFQFCQTIIPKKLGCTNDSYFEYDDEAEVNDGSCVSLIIPGCSDSNGWNFNPLANSEGDCIYLDVDVDVNVPSYDAVVSMLACLGSEANDNAQGDNTCENEAFQTIYWYDYDLHEGSSDVVESCIFDGPYGQQYCDEALENEPIELVSVLTGTCYASDACNYLEQGICDYTSCVGCQDTTAFNYDAEATVASECVPFIEGCIDQAACNFEPEANTDNGSCYNNNLGCGCDNLAPIEGLNCEGTAIQIGDEVYGGMVFQINEDGSGLVVSMEDIEVITWNNAQNAAANATTEGYDDWYLPNIDQLEILYNSIGPGGDNSLGLVFQAGQYPTHWKFWSSSVTPSNSNYVYILNFVEGEIEENYYPANWTYSSRAIRSF